MLRFLAAVAICGVLTASAIPSEVAPQLGDAAQPGGDVGPLRVSSNDCIDSGDFCTQSQGGWGTNCHGHNPGCLRDQYFAAVFPGGLIVGDPDGADGDGLFAIVLTSSAAVRDYLPGGGTPAVLSADYTNPNYTSAGVFGAQLVAATLNVAFDAAGLGLCTLTGSCSFANPPGTLGTLTYICGVDDDLIGLTVNEVLALANTAISGGGTPAGVSISNLNNALSIFNEAFSDCSGSGSCLRLDCDPCEQVDCDDQVACTVDSCVDGICQHEPNDGACDDAADCTLDSCDPKQGCLNIPDNSRCSDSIDCTEDLCVDGVCFNVPDNASCTDGVECTVDLCSPVSGCLSMPDDAACDDGNRCTIDDCVLGGGCVNTPIVCADGEFCNGVETCNPGTGECESSGDPCPGTMCNTCQEDTDTCLDPAGTPCDDQDPCTSFDGTPLGDDACDGMGTCLGTPIACSDEDICTQQEMCDPKTGECTSTFVPQCPGIDIVFIVDTSGSMLDEANTICDTIDAILLDVQNELDNPMFPENVPVSVTIYGISEDADDFAPPDFQCLTNNVQDVFGPEVPGNDPCPGLDGCSTAESRRESWGPATSIVAAEFPWQPPADAVRLIIPISDEGPCCGGDEVQFACGLTDMLSITNAIAIADDNGVVVSPIIGTLPLGAPMCIADFAAELADGTGGTSFNTSDVAQLPDAIVDLITSTCPCFTPSAGATVRPQRTMIRTLSQPSPSLGYPVPNREPVEEQDEE